MFTREMLPFCAVSNVGFVFVVIEFEIDDDDDDDDVSDDAVDDGDNGDFIIMNDELKPF